MSAKRREEPKATNTTGRKKREDKYEILADELAVSSRRDSVSCVDLKNSIHDALLSVRNEALEEAAKLFPCFKNCSCERDHVRRQIRSLKGPEERR